MKFKTIYGKEKTLKNSRQYLIDWNKKTRSKFQDEVKKFLYSYWKDDVVFEELRLVETRLTFDFSTRIEK